MRKRRVDRDRCLKSAAAVALAGGLAFGGIRAARADNATWNPNAVDGNWIPSTQSNWITGTGTYPGSTTGTTNTDTASFNSASTYTAIDLGSNLNIGSIAFDANAASYTIGMPSGGTLLLTAGGSVSILPSLTAAKVTETISAPILLEGNYTFANYGTDPTTVLNFNGGGITAAGGNVVLTLAGTNTGSNTISANISNGSATTLALLKTGPARGRFPAPTRTPGRRRSPVAL